MAFMCLILLLRGGAPGVVIKVASRHGITTEFLFFLQGVKDMLVKAPGHVWDRVHHRRRLGIMYQCGFYSGHVHFILVCFSPHVSHLVFPFGVQRNYCSTSIEGLEVMEYYW